MKQITVEQFIKMFSKKWHIYDLCPDCGRIISRPTKNFTECFVEYGVEGNKELTKACIEFQDAENKLWQLIHQIGFEFLDED